MLSSFITQITRDISSHSIQETLRWVQMNIYIHMRTILCEIIYQIIIFKISL